MSNSDIAVLITGSEIISGKLHDSNSNFLTKELSKNGFSTSHIMAVGDSCQEIASALQFLVKHCSTIIISGGLGPTTDDLTREAVAEFCNQKLIFHPEVYTTIEERFKRRGRTATPNNRKQAYFPETSTIIPNKWGTAPGFKISVTEEDKTVYIYSVPGVPSELKNMFGETILVDLIKRKRPISLSEKTLRVFGRGESDLGQAILDCSPPENINIAYRATFPKIDITLSSSGETPLLDKAFQKVKAAIGPEYIFSEDREVDYQRAVINLLKEKGLTLSTAESCTGGMLGELLTCVSGSSDSYLGGIISYSNAAKEKFLNVSSDTLKEFGAVSPQTAIQMAEGVRSEFSSNLGISITGIAGPGGGSDQKPVGTFHTALASEKGTKTFHFLFPGRERQHVRIFAAHTMLDILRRYLMDYPLEKLAYLVTC